MWRLLAALVLVASIAVPTIDAALIVEHGTLGPYAWDLYLDVERFRVSTSYTYVVEHSFDGGLLYWTVREGDNMYGSSQRPLTFARYRDKGEIVSLDVNVANDPHLAKPPVIERIDVEVEPLQEMCDGTPCPDSAAAYDWLSLNSYWLEDERPGDNPDEFRKAVENGGTIEWVTSYYVTHFLTPEPWEHWWASESKGDPGINARPTATWIAEFEFESVVATSVLYEPFAPVPEPGTATLFLIGGAFAGGAYVLRRSKLGLNRSA